ncbi:MAG: sigma-70 family RNA polymerase sigma factor [Parasphingorhabdus sp.]|nr:sigma-70 family RNA polymerase sigma factor [Parasphingorhabdus sp.]
MSSAFQQSSQSAANAQLIDLLVRAAQRDSRAAEALYNLTSAKLFGICLRICGNREAAEDVLQEAYIKIWNSAALYTPSRGSPISWMATVARNSAIDWQRRNRHDYAVDDALVAGIADDAPLADARIEAGQDRAKLHDCLDQLGEDQRTPIRSAFYGGLTYAALADQAALPLSTIKSRIRRGLAQLKKCLDGE